MYGIATVARLAQVSVRTLRHYDDLGLLKPAYVDPLTGYRHYRPEQVVRLHRILVLRDLGVSLSEVGQLIDDDLTVEQLRGILRCFRPKPAPGSLHRPSSSRGSSLGSRNWRRDPWPTMK